MTLRTDITGDDTQTDHAAQHNEANTAILALQYLTLNAQVGTSYTPVIGDAGKLVTLSNAAAISVSLPQDSDVAFITGTQIHFSQVGAGAVTFAAGTGATVNAIALGMSAQYGVATAIKRAANTWLLVGSLA